MVRKVVLIVLGCLLMVLGLAGGAAAAVVHGALDDQGRISVPVGTIDPGAKASALVVDIDRFRMDLPYLGGQGTTTLSADADGHPLFLGAGPTDDVDALLRGTSYAVGRLQSGRWTVAEVPGTAAPAQPAAQPLWWAADSGPHPTITLPAQRPLTLVAMDPTGAASGPVRFTATLTIARAPQVLRWGVIGSAVALILGIGLVTTGSLLRRRRGKHESAPDAA